MDLFQYSVKQTIVRKILMKSGTSENSFNHRMASKGKRWVHETAEWANTAVCGVKMNRSMNECLQLPKKSEYIRFSILKSWSIKS